MQARLHLLAQQLQRAHHPLMRNNPAAIHFSEDAGETELLPQPLQTIGDHLRRADDGLAAQRLVIADGLETLATLDPPCGVSDAGTACRFLEPGAQVAVEVHEALFGVRARLFGSVADIYGRAQI